MGERDPIEQLRASLAATPPAPPPLAAFVEKVHARAYAVSDGDVASLKSAGVSEDAIFEQTVAAAIAEGLRRLDAAERVLRR